MNLVEAIKALDNPTRRLILQWLKQPSQHFVLDNQLEDPDEVGVCVSLIKNKSGLSQSTISVYLSMLQSAGLVSATRRGTWTYYKRDEEKMALFLKQLGDEILITDEVEHEQSHSIL